MAEKIGETPRMPRVAKRQRYRSNTSNAVNCSCETDGCMHQVEQYFLLNSAIPFLDRIIVELESRFNESSKIAAKIIGIVPAAMRSSEVDVGPLVEQYSSDLPSPELLDEELHRWKFHFSSYAETELPDSVASALKICDPSLYPNIYVLLKVGCVLPVTSCECERSASVVRRLNNYMRASQSIERLSGLALMNVNYGEKIDPDEVLDAFAKTHPRKLELNNLLWK